MKESGIYKITYLPTGKVYVGSAVAIHTRWSRHRTQLRGGFHHSRYLQNAWNKYGEASFSFDVLEKVAIKELLCDREQYWIDTLQSANPEKGFNLSPTARSTLGVKHTEATKEKYRLRRLGTKHTEATKQKMSLMHQGSNNAWSKFTEDEVDTIRQELRNGESDHSVAAKHNTSAGAINSIKLGHRWKHVQMYEFLTGPRRGKHHWNSKLDADKVRQIRKHLQNGMISKDVGAIFGVSRCTIQDIKLGKTWKDLE